MKRWKLAVLLVVASLVSFLCGGIFLMVMEAFVATSEGDRRIGLEKLQEEATVFFYDTMRELFAGTYDQQDERVSAKALDVFNTYRMNLEPRCWLVNVKEDYGVFCGTALFPSGDVFEVSMRKTDRGWVLSWLNHLGTKYGFHDLSGNNGGEPGSSI